MRRASAGRRRLVGGGEHHAAVTGEALRRIAELYAIEASIRGQTADRRQDVRQTRSLPLLGAMKTWLEEELKRIPPRGGHRPCRKAR